MIALYGLIFLFFLLIVVYIFSYAYSNRTKENKLLADLGLIKRWTGERTTPFYKWGWKKISKERVWGERIVKSVFNKNKIWLSPEDYQYFESLCYANEEGKNINHNDVILRVKEIIYRNEHVSSHIGRLVQNVLTYATSVSNAEAEKLLREMKIKAERDEPITHLIKVQLRRKLKQAGIYILGNKPFGLELTNDEEEVIGKLKGFDSWIQFVRVYEEECLNQLSHKVTAPYDKIFNLVKKSVQTNLFKDFKTDIADAKKFYSITNLIIDEQELEVSNEEIRRLESILYTWKFDDNIRFGFVEHRQLRALVAQKDTAPRFRELLIKSITSDISSLGKMLSAFPRHVIFYGKNARARTFISQQYSYHFQRILETIPKVDKFQRIPPILIRIGEKEINDFRLNVEGLKEQEKNIALPNRQPIEFEMPQYIHNLVQHEMQANLNKLKINQETGDKIGWIINLGIDEPTDLELRELVSPEFSYYIRVNCDITADADYTSTANSAKEHRLMLFNSILDSLITIPSSTSALEPSEWSKQTNFATS